MLCDLYTPGKSTVMTYVVQLDWQDVTLVNFSYYIDVWSCVRYATVLHCCVLPEGLALK